MWVIHITGVMNVLPDTLVQLSRFHETEWMCHPEAFQWVCQRWWMPNIDLFTTRFSFQCITHQFQTHTFYLWTPWPSVGGIGCIHLSAFHIHPKRATVVPRTLLLPPAHRSSWPHCLWFPDLLFGIFQYPTTTRLGSISSSSIARTAPPEFEIVSTSWMDLISR